MFPTQPHKSSMNLDANLLSLLLYIGTMLLSLSSGSALVAWVLPLVIFYVERDSEFVRFHAMQLFVLSAGYAILTLILNIVSGIFLTTSILTLGRWFTGAGASFVIPQLLSAAASILFLVFGIIACINAWKYMEYEIPIVGGISRKLGTRMRTK